MDIRFGVVELQEQQLSNDAVGGIIVDTTAKEHDTVLEQATINIHLAFITPVFFNNVGDQSCHWGIRPTENIKSESTQLFFFLGSFLKHFINETICFCLSSGHVEVTLSIC